MPDGSVLGAFDEDLLADELLREDVDGIGIRIGSSSNTLVEETFTGSQPDFRFSVLISSLWVLRAREESLFGCNSTVSFLTSSVLDFEPVLSSYAIPSFLSSVSLRLFSLMT
jgi:hypothetical protein